MTRTYSLQQVAEIALPPEWTDSVRWLQRRLRRGEITGYKVGHVWRMTEQDVDDMLAKYRSSGKPQQVRPALSFTSTSQRMQRAS